MNRQTAIITLALATLVSASCTHAGGWASGTAWMRNESSETADVSIAFAGRGFLGRTDVRDFKVPPWQEGWCRYLGIGINPGEATISVSGPSVPFPITTKVTVPAPPDDSVSILIDARGEVHFGTGESPPHDTPCLGYGQALPDSP